MVTGGWKCVNAMLALSRTAFLQRKSWSKAGDDLVAFGARASLGKLTGQERLAFCLDSDLAPLPSTTVLRGHIDADSGILVSVEVPDPEMPVGEEGLQLGKKVGSLGRLLPGLNLEATDHGVRISGLMPGKDSVVNLAGVKLDEQGFLIVEAVTPPQTAPGCLTA